ncbi:MAG: RHS repeat-associated core domain-containing protein, partial [Bacteroidota bacterium]
FVDMDVLGYHYQSNSNKLSKVSDTGNSGYGFKEPVTTGDDYRYDPNGNLISDANKGITSISYNHLNLPIQVDVNTDNIQYIYDATGVKMRKTVSTVV